MADEPDLLKMEEQKKQTDEYAIRIAFEARRCLYTDPVHAARVRAALTVAGVSARVSTGVELSKREMTIATVAASIALVLAEHDPSTGEPVPRG